MKENTKSGNVKWKTLKEICKISTGKLNANAKTENGKYPFFTCQKMPNKIDRYSFDTEAVLMAGNGNVGNVHYYSGKFDAYQRTYIIESSEANVKFLYYYLKTFFKEYVENYKKEGIISYITLPVLEKFLVPLPPLKKQEEIAAVLDKFTELTEELTAREAQYNYYRDMLLSEDYLNKISEKLIKEFCPGGVEWKKLWEVTIWDKKFNGIEKYKQLKVNKYYYYLANDLKKLISEQGKIKILTTNKTNIFANEENVKENITDGEVVCIPWGGNPIIQYYKGKFITGDNRIATSYDTTKLNNKFLFYYLLNNIGLISSFYRGSGIKHPDMSKVLEMKIPIPPIEIQNKIVDFLDNFETLVNNIRQGLPREIQLRQKQYEYYREKLLTFKEK